MASHFSPRRFLNQLPFWFCFGTFINFSSTIADGKLLTCPINVLAFDSRFVIFVDPVILGLPPLRLWKTLSFPVVQSFSNPDVADGDILYGSAVADERSANLADVLVFLLPIQTLPIAD